MTKRKQKKYCLYKYNILIISLNVTAKNINKELDC